jgi:hypothetical protein
VVHLQAASYSLSDKLRDAKSKHVECRLPVVLSMQYFSGQAFNENDTESYRYVSVQYLNFTHTLTSLPEWGIVKV